MGKDHYFFLRENGVRGSGFKVLGAAPSLAASVQSNLRRNLMSYVVSGVRELRRLILTPET
jgi:hypothetical protein